MENVMVGCSSSLFGMSSSDPLKDTFLLYKKITEQYRDPEILRRRMYCENGTRVRVEAKNCGHNYLILLNAIITRSILR
jgi:hypothetical protein